MARRVDAKLCSIDFFITSGKGENYKKKGGQRRTARGPASMKRRRKKKIYSNKKIVEGLHCGESLMMLDEGYLNGKN